MYDLRSKITRAAIFAAASFAFAVMGIMIFMGNSIFICLLPFILAAVVFILCFILSFVPFFKDHLWLLLLIALLVSLVTGFIAFKI